MDVFESLVSKGEVGAQIVDLLFGDAAYEVSKALSEEGQKRQTRVAQISNAIGIASGAQGLYAATRDLSRDTDAAPAPIRGIKNAPKIAESWKTGTQAVRDAGTTGRLRTGMGGLKETMKNPKVGLGLAAGAVGLQTANLGGDLVTNAVLRRTNKMQNAQMSKSIEWTGEISKTDTDKRQVFGWASVTKIDGHQVEDLQGDDIDIEEIEKAAYDYVKNSRVGGNMHQKTGNGPMAVSKMIESVVIDEEKKRAMGLPEDFPEGWWVGFQVDDDNTWEAAKNGELAGFSIHGRGRRVPK